MRGVCTVIMAFWLACQPGVVLAETPTLPGVDLKDLDEDELAILMKVLKEQFDPCGKPRSFLEAATEPKDCPLATKLANFVVGQIQRGLSRRQIVRALLTELSRLTVRYKFTTKERPSVGPSDARVTVVEFFDFQCPYCRKVASDLHKLQKKKKDVRLVFKQYPLEFHKAAKPAAIAAIAAHMQGKFRQLHDKLFDDQDKLDDERIMALVKSVGLDLKRFKADQKKAAKLVKTDVREGDLASVDGTPTFFVNGLRCEFEELESQIDAALKGTK